MSKKNSIILLSNIIVSLVLAYSVDFSHNKIICYDFIINAEITLFSVSLAIVALMITILEKYKEKASNNINWAKDSVAILKEISENTVALLFIIIVLIVVSVFKSFITLIAQINIMNFILLFSFFLSLISIFDTTISVHKLVANLRDILFTKDENKLNLSQNEIQLVDAYRFLDESHKKEFEALIKTITLKQQLDTEQNKNT
nr:MAG TPA: hypothetical protein [Caudoviricetes sp.]